MNSYEIELNVPYVYFNNFKQKQTYNIQQVIGGSRLNFYMKFTGFGLITETKVGPAFKNIKIEKQEKFNRIRTNCMIFDLIENDVNKGYYDKCFIYSDNSGKSGFYGYILYNTTTGRTDHVYNINKESIDICKRLKKSFLLQIHHDKYKPYSY